MLCKGDSITVPAQSTHQISSGQTMVVNDMPCLFSTRCALQDPQHGFAIKLGGALLFENDRCRTRKHGRRDKIMGRGKHDKARRQSTHEDTMSYQALYLHESLSGYRNLGELSLVR
jgi:hypothetical protein